ncbi:MAG TPA: alpha/beta hydrolase [Terracidiphilus sp.]|jgi:pimeloyl-ACP methyl ester carboxylesterase
MKTGTAVLLTLVLAVAAPKSAAPQSIVYGSNPTAGHYFEHDGVRLYYEVYGRGPPLLVIHGNGLSIWWMKDQIAYFSRHYQVIAMDSRDHGKSADAPGPLTFEQMADDLGALLEHLHTGPALVLGWSDGGVEALLLGMRHPDKVLKIAAMAANLYPEGIRPEVLKLFGAAPEAQGSADSRTERVKALVRTQPHIRPEDLMTITAPTLVLAADHDLILDEHTLEIYHHLPNGQLVIFPNATHMISVDDPQRFNAAVASFFREPFVRKDRLSDVLKSLDRLKQEEAVEESRSPSGPRKADSRD